MRKPIYIASQQINIDGVLYPGAEISPWRMSEYSAISYAQAQDWDDYRVAQICFCYAYRRKIAKLWLKQLSVGLTEGESKLLRALYWGGAFRFTQDWLRRLFISKG